MKKLIILSAAILSSLALAGLSHAQTVGIQFSAQANNPDEELTPSDVAGLDSQTNFNLVPLNANISPGIYYYGPGTQGSPAYTGNQNEIFTYNDGTKAFTYTQPSGLVDSTGAATAITYSATGGGSAGGVGDSLTSANDKALLYDGLVTLGYNAGPTVTDANGNPENPNYYAGPATLTLENLNPLDSYTFLVYTASGGSLEQMSLSLNGGGTQYFTGATGGSYAPAAATQYQSMTSLTPIAGESTAAVGAFASNYVEFSDVVGSSSDTVALTELGNYAYGSFVAAGSPQPYNGGFGNAPAAIAGIQIIDNGLAPEPSTWALMLGGLVTLVVIQRRRKFMV